MTKLLEQAIEAVRQLPPDSQDEIARFVLHLASGEEPEPIDADHLPAILEGLAGVNLRLMRRSKPRSAASTGERSDNAAGRAEYRSGRPLRSRTQSGGVGDGRRRNLAYNQHDRAVPERRPRAIVPRVRKLGVLHYPYLIYFAVDEADQVVLILAVQHAARSRRHTDA